MGRAASIRAKIENKIFTQLGTDGSLETVASDSIDKWGDNTRSFNTATTVRIVPYNTVYGNEVYEKFGDLKENETDVAISYDTTFNVEDKITWNSITYKVIRKEPFILEGLILVYAARLVKIL